MLYQNIIYDLDILLYLRTYFRSCVPQIGARFRMPKAASQLEFELMNGMTLKPVTCNL